MTSVAIFVLLAAAPADAGSEVEEIDEIEEVVDLDALEEAEYVPPAPTVSQTISRMHAALVHLPIGALFVALLLELIALVRRRDELHRASWLTLVITGLAFVPAAATGWMQLSGMDAASPRLDLTLSHRNLMLIAFGLLITAAALGRGVPTGSRAWSYRGLLVIALGLVTAGGHLGGKLVFGEHYLPF